MKYERRTTHCKCIFCLLEQALLFDVKFGIICTKIIEYFSTSPYVAKNWVFPPLGGGGFLVSVVQKVHHTPLDLPQKRNGKKNIFKKL